MENYSAITANEVAPAMPLPLLHKYGFDATARNERLRLMGLVGLDGVSPEETKFLNEKIILPCARTIIDEFYGYLLNFPSMRELLPDSILPGLKRTQEEYLRSFGVDYASPEYFEYRLRIGIAHERVGLSLSLYQAAYRELTSLIINAIPDSIRQNTLRYQQLVNLIVKIAALDMSLATDTYTAANFSSMKESIKYLSEKQRELLSEVCHDTVTGIYSRRYLLDQLEKMTSAPLRRNDREFCVAMLDLDFFKKINDSHGHLVGDQMLQHVAKLMLQSIRGIDLLGRYGGEEFLLIFPGTGIQAATQVAERIRQNIATHPLVVSDQLLSMTVSIGIAECLQEEKEYQAIIARADKTLYAAKNAGRNCVRTA